MPNYNDIKALAFRLERIIEDYHPSVTVDLVLEEALANLSRAQEEMNKFLEQCEPLFNLDKEKQHETRKNAWVHAHLKDLKLAGYTTDEKQRRIADQLTPKVLQEFTDLQIHRFIYHLIEFITQLRFVIRDPNFIKLCDRYYQHCVNTFNEKDRKIFFKDFKHRQDDVGKYVLVSELDSIMKKFELERIDRMKKLKNIFAPAQSKEFKLLGQWCQEFSKNFDIEGLLKKIALLKIQHKGHYHFSQACNQCMEACLNKIPTKQLIALREKLTEFQETYEGKKSVAPHMAGYVVAAGAPSKEAKSKEVYVANKAVLEHINQILSPITDVQPTYKP